MEQGRGADRDRPGALHLLHRDVRRALRLLNCELSRALHLLRWLPSLVLLLPWLAAPLAPSTADRLRDLSGPASFRLLDWETVHLGERAARLWQGLLGTRAAGPADVDVLRAYFGRGADKATLRPQAERALEDLVGQAYQQAGVPRSQPLLPAGASDRLFPPPLVALTPPPNVLVIAPRTALRVSQSFVLSAMDVPAQERLEDSADSTGVSSLVAPIGGLATYPSMVLEDDTPQHVLAAVAHEWLHQYLIFYPLGRQYWDSQETREINETTAEMIGQEIGTQLAQQLELQPPSPPGSPAPSPPAAAIFDFRAFMRQTRLATEQLLAQGQVDQAEAFMRARRDELQQHGYQIRKLNQAYFALYGSYGEGFAASPANPIPDLLRHLRDRASLADFLVQIRQVTSVAQPRALAQEA